MIRSLRERGTGNKKRFAFQIVDKYHGPKTIYIYIYLFIYVCIVVPALTELWD
jgi:hypothetical protein